MAFYYTMNYGGFISYELTDQLRITSELSIKPFMTKKIFCSLLFIFQLRKKIENNI